MKVIAMSRETQNRVSAITMHREALGRERLAEHLAYNTDMTADQAIAALKASAKGKPDSSKEAWNRRAGHVWSGRRSASDE
jgi:DNA-binding protein H-NS